MASQFETDSIHCDYHCDVFDDLFSKDSFLDLDSDFQLSLKSFQDFNGFLDPGGQDELLQSDKYFDGFNVSFLSGPTPPVPHSPKRMKKEGTARKDLSQPDDFVMKRKYKKRESQAGEKIKTSRSPTCPTFKQTSSFRGVSCCGKDRKWQARIRDSNTVRYLGRYESEVKAAFVYDRAARELKGEFAATNFARMNSETQQQVQMCFIENNGVLPESLQHLVSPRNKSEDKKEKRIDYVFDSPTAKLVSGAPSIDPTDKIPLTCSVTYPEPPVLHEKITPHSRILSKHNSIELTNLSAQLDLTI